VNKFDKTVTFHNFLQINLTTQSMLKEFKIFIAQGNVLDLAVGVIIGAAFGKITTSLVEDIINPILGLVTGGIDFSQLKIVLKAAVGETPEVAIRYGNFLNIVIQFLIIAWVVFLIVKAANRFRSQEKKE
jgi:large conductance mechanosensitive channel